VPRRHPQETIAQLKRRHWVLGIVAGLLALAALVSGSAFGKVRGHDIDPRVIAWTSAAALAIFGPLASNRLSTCLARLVSQRYLPSAGSAVRIVSAAVGYLMVLFGVLAILDVSIGKLLVGAGLAGIVLGIAATQSLGNVFAGVVLLLARPFSVGDHVRIRSGQLGGIFDAWVVETTLTYTTVRLADGPWKIPNAAMLAAGVGQLPKTAEVPPLPQVPGAVPAAAAGTGPASGVEWTPAPTTGSTPPGEAATDGTSPS
jgi:small-conductance mechanosensitive channel